MYNRNDKRISNAVDGVKELNRNTRRQPSKDMTEAMPSTSSASSNLPEPSDERVGSPSEASENHPDRSVLTEYLITITLEHIQNLMEFLLETHDIHYIERVAFELRQEIEKLPLNFDIIDEDLHKELLQKLLEKYTQADQDSGSSRSQSGDDASLGLNRMDEHNCRTRLRTDPAFKQIQMRHLNHSETSSKDRGDQQDENINICRTRSSAPIEEPYDDNRFSAKATSKKTLRNPFYIRDQAGRKRGHFSRTESTSSRSLQEDQSSISVLRRELERKNKTTFWNLHDASTENSEDSSDEVQDDRGKRS